MFANPDIQAWFDRLQGQPRARGSAPDPGYRNALAAALAGAEIIRPQVQPDFRAPVIDPRFRPMAPAPNPPERGPTGIPPAMPSSSGAPKPDLGGGAVKAGLEKLGQGIEGALGDLAAKQKAKDAAIANANALPAKSPVFGQPSQPAASGASGTNGAVAASPLPSSPPVFGSVGATSDTPIFSQPGTGTGPIGGSIGASGSLPTFAQGVPGAGMTTGQFLNGIKVGEGVPYSGQSPTGAIGAYGLTGGFIKQWAPGAGLPTDRASYMTNPELQDKLATYAATQMYNKYGDWGKVANAWLTGSPTATVPSPGNMSPHAYVDKVMNAAAAGAPVSSAPPGAAYAAGPPSSLTATGSQLTGDVPTDTQHGTYNGQDYTYQAPAGNAPASPTPPIPSAPSGNSQGVIPGQGDPHQPGFDSNSVPFINTPVGGQQSGMNAVPPGAMGGLPAGQEPAMNPLAVALLNDPNAASAFFNMFGFGGDGGGAAIG